MESPADMHTGRTPPPSPYDPNPGQSNPGQTGKEGVYSIKVGKLNLVDLAGSERVHVTGAVSHIMAQHDTSQHGTA